MKPFIVIADGMDFALFQKLQAHPELDVYPKCKVSQEQLKKLLPKVGGLVIRSATQVTSELIDAAPGLKYVIRAGEGTDNINKSYCQKKDIRVSNTPGANNNSAAEHALALMMTVLRKTAWAHQSMSQGKWEKNLFSGNELTGKKIGIVGFGRIGQLLAKRLQGFEPDILFYDPFLKKSELPHTRKVETLEELFTTADIVSIHVPLIPQTKNLIGQSLLDKMPAHAVLVNASRGGIVNEHDLLKILKEKKIRGAGFDVFATEPLPSDSPLLTLENLLLTPHLGASTEEAQVRVGEMVIHQLQEFFVNHNLLNEVRA